jgi:hypothetical protein
VGNAKWLIIMPFGVSYCDLLTKAQYFVRVTEYPECVTAPVINFYN